jgi:hypothetical protein
MNTVTTIIRYAQLSAKFFNSTNTFFNENVGKNRLI